MHFPLQDIEGDSGKIVCFESFGVRVGIKSSDLKILKDIAVRLEAIFPVGTKPIENSELSQVFEFIRNDDGSVGSFLNGEKVTEAGKEDSVLSFVMARVRLTVAEFAVSKVFVHAGVVVWNEKAIILPGNSFSGKTTLVRELIQKGAVYYSDEYAIIDENGLVHPFPKTLSIRGIIDDFQQVEHTAQELGGKIGIKPCRVGMIFFSEYADDAIWDPKPLTKGETVLKIVSFTLPIRVAPAFSLEVLQKAAENALTYESMRGEAESAAKVLLTLLDKSHH